MSVNSSKVIPGKWCSQCRKLDHNDDECWSTRAAPHRYQVWARLVPPSHIMPTKLASGVRSTLPVSFTWWINR
jgi:hypothetical protein